MNNPIADFRREYATKTLVEKEASEDPMMQFEKWWNEAIKAEIIEPNAMTLATASSDGMPSARIVLLKGFDSEGFVFYTNYKSYKGLQLEENPKACLVFFWKELERQVRITGLVQKIPAQKSDEYFLSRPEGSQMGAWASPQSQVIENREWIDDQYVATKKMFTDKNPGRPAHWGGYKIRPVIMEFWQGRQSRLHDRLQYSLDENGKWKIERLAP